MCWEAMSAASMPRERCVLTRSGFVCDHFRLKPSGASRHEAVGRVMNSSSARACIVVTVELRFVAEAETIVQ